MLHQIKAQLYTDLGLYQQCLVLQKVVEFKDLSMLLSDFQVPFKAGLIFKNFSRKPTKESFLTTRLSSNDNSYIIKSDISCKAVIFGEIMLRNCISQILQ